MNFHLINVGISDLKIAKSPDVLRTILGSCVGACLYDTEKKIAGLAHIMLPNTHSRSPNPKKYADSAIPLLVEEIIKAGARRHNLVSKIVGGATMFRLAENSIMGEIGKNNSKKVIEILESLGIPIIAQDIGGDYGRTIDFYAENGNVKIKSLGKNEKII